MTDRSDYHRDMPAPECVSDDGPACDMPAPECVSDDGPAFRVVTAEDRARWAAVDQQRTTLDQAREHVAKRAAMAADMQPECGGAVYHGGMPLTRVADLPAKWRAEPQAHQTDYWLGWAQCRDAAANELSLALAREPHLTLSADAVQTLAGSRDLERRCKQLERKVDVYRRALAQIINVHALEKP